MTAGRARCHVRPPPPGLVNLRASASPIRLAHARASPAASPGRPDRARPPARRRVRLRLVRRPARSCHPPLLLRLEAATCASPPGSTDPTRANASMPRSTNSARALRAGARSGARRCCRRACMPRWASTRPVAAVRGTSSVRSRLLQWLVLALGARSSAPPASTCQIALCRSQCGGDRLHPHRGRRGALQLHILLRFDLERQLITGARGRRPRCRLEPTLRRDFGLEVTDPRQGRTAGCPLVGRPLRLLPGPTRSAMSMRPSSPPRCGRQCRTRQPLVGSAISDRRSTGCATPSIARDGCSPQDLIAQAAARRAGGAARLSRTQMRRSTGCDR